MTLPIVGSQLDSQIRSCFPDWRGLAEFVPVVGGDIHQAFQLTDGNRRLFLKVNQRNRLPMFQAEFSGLCALRQTQTIRVPEPILSGEAGHQSFLLTEFLPLHAHGGNHGERMLGEALAALHRTASSRFGFESDNFIGHTPQPNGWSDSWPEFFREQRLLFQFQRLSRRYPLKSVEADLHALSENLEAFFDGYRPKPSLIHGDLWSGNWAFHGQTGEPVIYDPAVYYADHEMELAMMELFGGPGQAFFEAYEKLYPIHPGYQHRRRLYQLYHILNHANLFAGHYVNQAIRLIQSLAAQV